MNQNGEPTEFKQRIRNQTKRSVRIYSDIFRTN